MSPTSRARHPSHPSLRRLLCRLLRRQHHFVARREGHRRLPYSSSSNHREAASRSPARARPVAHSGRSGYNHNHSSSRVRARDFFLYAWEGVHTHVRCVCTPSPRPMGRRCTHTSHTQTTERHAYMCPAIHICARSAQVVAPGHDWSSSRLTRGWSPVKISSSTAGAFKRER